MLMDTEILERMGLIENEIKIYLQLLKTGPSLASEISKSTKLHRTHVYDLLDSLIKKSIVSYVIRENRKYFQAADPNQLKSLLKEKQEQIENDKKKLGDLIKELTAISIIAKPKLLVSVYEGKRGFKTLLEDILRRKQDYLVLGYNPKADESLRYFLPGFYKRRIKLGIKRRAIVDPALRGSWVKDQKLQKIRFFKYEFPTGIIIYADRVVLTIIQETGQVAIVIENQRIANNFKKLFESIWRTAEP
jgi:sugar-specific transcriptional regulator TrmB